MDEILEFQKWLGGKVQEEIPDLHPIMAVYDQRSWRDCRMALADYLMRRFGAAAMPIAESLRGPEETDGRTHAYRMPLSADSRKNLARVFIINMDQARLAPGDELTTAKGMIVHETGHLVAGHRRNEYFRPLNSHEEGVCDLFNTAVMANRRQTGHAANIVSYRLRSPFMPGILYIPQPDHPFPALIEAAQPLLEKYAKKAPGDFSVKELMREAEQVVAANTARIKLWQEFGRAALSLAERGFTAPEVLALAQKAGSPFVETVEKFSGFRRGNEVPLLADGNPFYRFEEDNSGEKMKEQNQRSFIRSTSAAPPWFGFAIMHDSDVVLQRRPG